MQSTSNVSLTIDSPFSFHSSQLYKPDVLEDLMKESEHVVQRRKECVKMYVPILSLYA